MIYDIPGIIRQVIGFNKIPSKYGNHLAVVEYDLKPIDLNYLRELFNVDPNDPDLGVRDIIDPLDINEEQAKALQPYVIDGTIDLDKYFFELHCYADPEYNGRYPGSPNIFIKNNS
jgi:hypothetical protein